MAKSHEDPPRFLRTPSNKMIGKQLESLQFVASNTFKFGSQLRVDADSTSALRQPEMFVTNRIERQSVDVDP